MRYAPRSLALASSCDKSNKWASGLTYLEKTTSISSLFHLFSIASNKPKSFLPTATHPWAKKHFMESSSKSSTRDTRSFSEIEKVESDEKSLPTTTFWRTL